MAFKKRVEYRASPTTGIVMPRSSNLEYLRPDEVLAVRARLRDLGYNAGQGTQPDETLRDALDAFQTKMKLRGDAGQLGTETWAALFGQKAPPGQRAEMLLSPKRIADLAQKYELPKEKVVELGELVILFKNRDDEFQTKALLHLPNRLSNMSTVNELFRDLSAEMVRKPRGWHAKSAGRPWRL